ncbi:MAG TPA: PIN domain-containing protein [Spirochaetota bacterium]|nr:PIN domain-containing protein [Spirochaetota bacterium]HOF01277.1 PIN domain-containing protein [Spirochaetota bacterium]HOS33775.1 PIN domain-containing protein [Spirochaetota bacterium]HOS56264.1 PIN domain-containing protein [Spirochaetota bacterium]HPY88285.1 PIN domain-containing protein [Spirochaetota bacterium]
MSILIFFFSAFLKKDTIYFKLIMSGNFDVYICEFNIVELFKHKEKIIKNTKLSLKEILEIFYLILKRVKIFHEDDIPRDILRKSYEYCKEKDPNDAVFVAAAMCLKAKFWTGDSLKDHLLKNGFTDVVSTNDLMKQYKYNVSD